MNKFNGIKRPPLINTYSEYDNCPQISKKPVASLQSKDETKPFQDSFGDISSQGLVEKKAAPKQNIQPSNSPQKSADRTRLIVAYSMLLFIFTLPWVGPALGLTLGTQFLFMLQMSIVASLGLIGTAAVSIGFLLLLLVSSITPLVMSLRRKNKPETSNFAKSHFAYISNLYKVFMIVLLASIGIYALSIPMALLAAEVGLAFMAISGILFSVINIVYYFKTIKNIVRVIKCESDDDFA